MKKIIIASKNPVKINAVKNGFKQIFSKETFEFIGISVESGVSDQPLSDKETLQGAINRANNTKKKYPNADFWVGIEGGLEKVNNELQSFAWIITLGKDKIGKGKTGVFFLPQKVAKLIEQGKELGEADDIVFGHTNSKQNNGAVGILTNNIVTRTSYYTEAVIFSLIPFQNPKLY